MVNNNLSMSEKFSDSFDDCSTYFSFKALLCKGNACCFGNVPFKDVNA